MFHVNQFHTTHNEAMPYCREVNEHKAPTDDSVRLLREMEAAARQEMVTSIIGSTENSILNFKAAWFCRDGLSGHVFCYTLVINGHEIHGEYKPDVPFRLARSRNEDIRAMLKSITDAISYDILMAMTDLKS